MKSVIWCASTLDWEAILVEGDHLTLEGEGRGRTLARFYWGGLEGDALAGILDRLQAQAVEDAEITFRRHPDGMPERAGSVRVVPRTERGRAAMARIALEAGR